MVLPTFYTIFIKSILLYSSVFFLQSVSGSSLLLFLIVFASVFINFILLCCKSQTVCMIYTFMQTSPSLLKKNVVSLYETIRGICRFDYITRYLFRKYSIAGYSISKCLNWSSTCSILQWLTPNVHLILSQAYDPEFCLVFCISRVVFS